jgi:hypothetical protein
MPLMRRSNKTRSRERRSQEIKALKTEGQQKEQGAVLLTKDNTTIKKMK